MASATHSAAAQRLAQELSGRVDLVLDPDVLEGYRRDQAAPGFLSAGFPAAVARPRSTVEVQAAVRVAAACRVPIVPRGAGSGLTGGANAIDDCLVVSLERMTDIAEVDGASLTATMQAGVVNADLGAAAAAAGLWYAPDPASYEFSTIGGNVATNAGGLCCVKYGVTRDALLGLEVVLADGRAVRVGRRTRKGVAGYDLAGLLCGSEGTLGIVTEATLQLRPPRRHAGTVVASFAEPGAAAEALAGIVRECDPSMLEIMDRATVNAVQDFKPMDLDRDAAVLLFARSDTALRDAEAMAERCEQAGATLTVISDDEPESRMLLAARRLAYPALERLGTTLLDDVCVPVGAVPALLHGIQTIAADHGLLIATFGHAGDGNMHPTIVFDHRHVGEVARARVAFVAIVELALKLGGTVTGEHGVGLLKQDLLSAELGEALAVHRAIKRALDPQDLLNPGKAGVSAGGVDDQPHHTT